MSPAREEFKEDNKTNMFCVAAIDDAITGTIYSDNIGRFPMQSLEGALYLFLLYDYRSNAILVKPLKTMDHKEFVKAFQEQVTYLKKKGLKPKFNVIDNIVSKAVQEFLESENINIQIVEPHNHPVNAVGRAIQTFKDHFIAGLCTTDKQFPIQLWDQLLEQGQDTLNMLRTSHIHPHLSAYTTLEGVHDFNPMQLAPPGTRAIVYEPTETRGTWGPRGSDAWYVGPANQHYRCYRFYLPEHLSEQNFIQPIAIHQQKHHSIELSEQQEN